MEQIFTLQAVKKVIGLDQTPSTHALARFLAAKEGDGTLFLANCQTAAKNKEGIPLFSGEGGVYFTLLLSPNKLLKPDVLAISLQNAISDTLAERLPIKTKIAKNGAVCVYVSAYRQWKQCAEIFAEDIGNKQYLVSANIYVNNRLPVSLQAQYINLKTFMGRDISKELFLEEVLTNFWKEYAFL